MEKGNVPNMCHFPEGSWDLRERAIAQHARDLCKGGDFEWGLDLIQRLAVGGFANAQAVNG